MYGHDLGYSRLLLPEYRDEDEDIVDEIEEDDYYKVEDDFDYEIDDSKFYK